MVFVHFNQQAEYAGKRNITLADCVRLNTTAYPKQSNIVVNPTNATCTQWRVEWGTNVSTTTEVDFRPRGVGDMDPGSTDGPDPAWHYTDMSPSTHHVARLTDWEKAPVPTGEQPMAVGDTIW